MVTVDDQPELLHIKEKYIDGGGNFWVAKESGKVVGTIGLMNAGNGVVILKKFFVYEPYRSFPHNLGRQLYAIFLDFAQKHNFSPVPFMTLNTFSQKPCNFSGRIWFLGIYIKRHKSSPALKIS